MRSPLALVLSLALTTAVHAAEPPGAVTNVPAGAHVRLTLADRPGPLTGTLLRAQSDSLFVLPQGGGPELAVPISSLGSFAFMDGVRPSPRKATILGIALGAAGGAVLGVVAGQAQGEGGGGGGGGEGGGGEGGGGPDNARFAVTAVTPAQARATQDYRAMMGAVAGGLVGGLLGSFTGLGMSEARWTPVTPPTRGMSWSAPHEAPAVFAVRVPLPFRAAR